MKKLTRIDEDAWGVFKAIRDGKQGEREDILLALSSSLRNRYAQYEQHRMSLEHIPAAEPPFDKQQQDALRHCYDSKTVVLSRLRQQILQRQSNIARSKCQYCGIDSPGTFDHYLPCTHFPEFSVYPDNLVPCCHACNSQRGACWCKNGERLHINLYFDEIEAHERFLVATISFDEDGEPRAEFHVDSTRGSNHAFALRYKRHCTELKLLERFQTKAAPALLEQICVEVRTIAASFHQDANDIARRLGDLAEGCQRMLGPNNWEVALRWAASESQEFLTYCLTRDGRPR